MATVPYTGAGPDVAPDTRPPDDYSRLDVNADQFGASIGRGLQQAGQGIEQAEHFHGQVAADDATNAFQSQADKLLNGDPSKQVQGPDGTMVPDSGFYGLRGEAAMRAWPQVQAQIDQLRQQGGAGLPSPEARLQFESYTRRLQSSYLERGASHAQQQSQAWRTNVNGSTAELARQSIAANPEDSEALKHGLADLTAARVREAQATSGGDPTVMRAAEQQARAEGATTQVEALLNRNPTLAKQVLDNSRTILQPQVYDQLVNRLRPMLAGDQASEAIQRAADGRAVEGGPVMHTAPAGGSPTISDVDAMAAEKRLCAGVGTDADRALRATYLQQQNTPAGQQPQAVPAGTIPAAAPAAANGLPQEGPMPPERGDGGPPTSPDAHTIQQPAYADWRGTLSKQDRADFDKIALRDATKNKVPLPQAQAALYQTISDQATAKGAALPGGVAQPMAAPSPPAAPAGAAQPGQPTAAADATAVTSPRHADFVSAQQLKAAEAAAQIRDRKPVLSDADKAADAADHQLLDRYKASHGIPRTTGIDIAKLPDDPPQAMRDTSPEPVPHPDTHVLPPHPHADPTQPAAAPSTLDAIRAARPAEPYSRQTFDRWYGGLSDNDKEYFAGRITERAAKEGVSHDQARQEIYTAVHAPQPNGTAVPYSPAAYDTWSNSLSRNDRASFDDLVAQKQRQQGVTQDAARKQVFDAMQAVYVRGDAPRPTGRLAPPAASAPAGAPAAPVPTFARSAGGLPAPTPGAPALPFFAAIGAQHGISGNFLARTKQIESGSGSGVGAVSSSGATGPFQFTRDTARRMGLVDPNDLRDSADAAARLAALNKTALTRTLGREPTDAELYLAHQQGSGGASKLLANPNVRAGDLVGDSAIRSNGGDPNAPASAFVAKWRDKFNGIKTAALPSFATGFGSGQPYFGGTPGPGVLPPLPSAAPLPDPVPPAPSLPAPAPVMPAPAGVAPPPAPPSMGQVPPLPVADQASQALPPPVAYNADDPSSPLPDRALAIAHARALANGDPIQARANIAEVNRRYSEQNAITATERMELAQQLPDLNAAASAGVDGVALPERDIRRLYPPAKAQQIIGDFHANQAVGALMRGVQFASPDQLQEMQRDLSSGLGVYSDALRSHRGRATTGAGTTGATEDGTDLGFFRRREIAAKQINAEIQHRAALLVGPEADPAAYVAAAPNVRQAMAGGNFESYANASLGMQSYLGVPDAQQHVMTRGQAISLAGRIMAAPDPKAELQRQAAAAGSAWPKVFGDAMTLGRLPPAYQAVQMLDDPHDAALLSRTLAAEKPGPDGKPGKAVDDTVDTMAGAKGEATKIRDAVRFDPDLRNYVQSIQKSGASPDQVEGIVNSVETLALAKRAAGEAGDSGASASAAVKSFFGKFEYMPDGGARVPSKVFDAVTANARATLDGLSLDHVAVPERFGQPGQPEPREYLDTIKAAPSWVTSPRSDAVWLMDYAGRFVRGRDGQPIAVPFSLPGPAPVVRAPPLAGVSTLPGPAQPGAMSSPAAAAAARAAAANPAANVVPGL